MLATYALSGPVNDFLGVCRDERAPKSQWRRIKDRYRKLRLIWDSRIEAWNKFAQMMSESEAMVADGASVEEKEVAPFFRLSVQCQSGDIAGDPDRIRTGDLCLDRAVC